MIQPAASPLYRKPAVRLALALLLLAITGCVYRMAIQQGNFLDPKQVAQLQTGMTRSQVRFLLGTPMLPDGFNRDRWDYVYYLKISQLKRPDERRLSVFFEDDKVARIENVGVPAAPAVEPAPPAATEAAAGAPVAPAATAAATGAAPSPEPAAPR